MYRAVPSLGAGLRQPFVQPRHLPQRLWPVALVSAFASFNPAQAASISWATQATSFGGGAPGVVGSPDSIVENKAAWRATQFSGTVSYGGLAQAMGLGQSQLANYDVIAWESNGGSPPAGGGWESASWAFSANGVGVGVEFNEVTGSGDLLEVSFLTGSITGAQYNALFGTSVPQAEAWSWLLVKLPREIDAHAASFAIDFAAIGNRPGWGEGSPDPDAIGVLSSVPEPGTWALMGIGLAALRWRQRRQS